MTDQQSEQQDKKSPGLGSIVFAVLASAFGVNSSKNREKDFNAKSATPFIVAGIIFTIVFMASVYGVVQLVLPE
ncbi:MAG: hypothetical protein RL336_217 [Pseudomonadota bacterium]|jgi:hypothetical protein